MERDIHDESESEGGTVDPRQESLNAAYRQELMRHLRAQEPYLRRGTECMTMTTGEYRRFCEFVADYALSKFGNEPVSDEEIVARGYKVNTVKGIVRRAKGLITRRENQRTTPQPRGFDVPSGANPTSYYGHSFEK